MLDLIGRIGDGWVIPLNTYMSREEIKASQQLINASAKKNNRPLDAIARVANLVGVVDEQGRMDKSSGDKAPFIGSSSDWVDWLVSSYTDLGIDTFIIWPSGDGQEESQLRLFADRIVPKARAAIEEKVQS
jgi:hypothetical protein